MFHFEGEENMVELRILWKCPLTEGHLYIYYRSLIGHLILIDYNLFFILNIVICKFVTVLYYVGTYCKYIIFR